MFIIKNTAKSIRECFKKIELLSSLSDKTEEVSDEEKHFFVRFFIVYYIKAFSRKYIYRLTSSGKRKNN